jgi:pimeloyl-ACP methyl ester carboxylesterase
MKNHVFIIFFLLNNLTGPAICQDSLTYSEDSISIECEGDRIFGSLIVPDNTTHKTAALIIAGSGPTDRNGNNPYMSNNSLKMLAESLARNGISSIRYDKRGVGASMTAGIPEKDLRFENYVDDAASWIRFIQNDERFEKVIVIGHSEGSLIGMMASVKTNADAFISIAGQGESADLLLKRQLEPQPQVIKDELMPMIDSLKNGHTLNKVDPVYFALFRPSVQPYMISWFKYDPQSEIRKLSIPILIIQGTSDIQVGIQDADLLIEAAPEASIEIIEGMNHIFKPSSTDRQENIATYQDPDLPIMEELIKTVVEFIFGSDRN